MLKSGFLLVLENLQSPGIRMPHFPGLESQKGFWSWKGLEINYIQIKKYETNVWLTLRRIKIEILRMKRLHNCKFQRPGKINLSPGKVLEI